MKTPSFVRKSAYSALVFFGTLGILSAGYAGFVTLQSSDADSGKSLTSTMMQAVIGNLADLDSRVTGVSGNVGSLSGTVSGLSTSLISLSGAVSSLQVSAGSLWGAVTGGIGYSAGNVGIGTSTPSASLEIKRTAADGNFAAWIEGSSASNYGLGVNVAGVTSATAIADFKSGNASKLFVRADGNIGIGTATPGNKLHIYTASQASEGMAIGGADGHTISISGSRGAGGSNALTQAGDASIIYSNSALNTGALVIGPWSNAVGGAGIRMDGAGNVGIGVANPSTKLDVSGQVRIAGATARPMILGTTDVSNGGGLSTQGDTGGWAFWYHAKGSSGTDRGGFGFAGNADILGYYYIGSTYTSPSLAVLPSGNVGIGTIAPSQKLQVAGTIYSTSGGFKFPDGTVQTTSAATGVGAGRVTGGCYFGVAWGTATACGLSQSIVCSAGNAGYAMTFHSPAGAAGWNSGGTYASGFCISQ